MTDTAEHLTVRCHRCQQGYRNRLPGSLCDCAGGVLLDVRRSGTHKNDPLIGQIIGQSYAIFDRLGSGAMGSVYKARHVRLDRLAAIKIIGATSQDDAHDEELRSRFLREAKALSNVRHESVITVYDYGSHVEKLYMVLEFVGGQNLWQLLRNRNGLPIERALPILRQLTEAVGAIHAVKIVHRDLKPSNIMIDDSQGADRVVLIDFGIAKTLTPTGRDSETPPLTQAGLLVGTPKYMAPEQLMNGALGQWTDIYALGVLVFRMLSGQTPFNGHQAEIAASHLRDPVPKLPSQLQLGPFDAVIRKAMNKDPAGRFQGTKQLESALIEAWVAVSGTDAVKMTQPIDIVQAKSLDPTIDHSTSLETTTTEHVGNRPLVDQSLVSESGTMTAAESDGSQSGWRGVIEAPLDKELHVNTTHRRARLLWVAVFIVASAGLVYYTVAGHDSPVKSPSLSKTTQALGQRTIEVFTMKKPSVPTAPQAQRPASSKPVASKTTGINVSKGPDASRMTAPQSSPMSTGSKPVVMRPKPKLIVVKPKRAEKKLAVKKKHKRRPFRKRRTAAAETKAKKGLAALILKFDAQLEGCSCPQARRTLRSMERASKERVKTYRQRYNLACSVIGMGCNTYRETP